MAFDWREYLKLSKALAGQATADYSVEAAQRAAVSRAYYAAFCWARNYAEKNLGFQRTGRGEDHKLLREHLKGRGRARLASHLNRLRNWRNNCDYDDDVPELHQYVKSALSIAEKAIQECS